MSSDRADNFLRLIRRSQRGRLKIYLGYAAGVGKTYQMLLEGHRIKEDGIDLVVGMVETHGRLETVELVEGLEVIPRLKTTYRGIEAEEMDLEGILSRRPSVVLVDELAHTNLPGSKNAKRYQDIEELLEAGIHVISTLNIQHLESLYETVERATAIKVRERIPDRVIAESDELVNVDVTIEDLRRRLKNGKVYTKERIESALENFFKPTNLEQLRELALRELAAQIDSRRRDPQNEEIPFTPDQVMVCLSSRGPNSEALLRYASRLAGRLNRNWYAVYVQTSMERPAAIDATTQRILSNTLTLAQQLGATVFTYKGEDIAKTILQFAREYRVGHVVIGTPGKKLPFWKRLCGEISIVEKLITEGRGITVVVPDTKSIYDEKPAYENSNEISSANPGSNKAVLIWEDLIAKDEAIKRLLDSIAGLDEIVKKQALESISCREQQGGTYIGDDVSIPHARVEGLKSSQIAIGIAKAGINDPDAGRTIHLMVLLISPIDSQENHLKMLSEISRMLRDDHWRKSILAASSINDVIKIMGST
ncbi:MAG: PTS sugar transporter subunit IIA [Candidatus Riflebacteria bacterium]|nr:PTS sugar transporter subunit IIA [Candidatus Riflebacteria bacterium]